MIGGDRFSEMKIYIRAHPSSPFPPPLSYSFSEGIVFRLVLEKSVSFSSLS